MAFFRLFHCRPTCVGSKKVMTQRKPGISYHFTHEGVTVPTGLILFGDIDDSVKDFFLCLVLFSPKAHAVMARTPPKACDSRPSNRVQAQLIWHTSRQVVRILKCTHGEGALILSAATSCPDWIVVGVVSYRFTSHTLS